MRALLVRLMILWIFYNFSKGVFELGGEPGTETPKKEENLPRTVKDLQTELPRVPKNVCRVFGMAVEHQLNGEYHAAGQLYGRLHQIPLKDGGFVDLAEKSETFRFNTKLLRDQINKDKSGG